MSPRLRLAARFILPAVWLGLIIAIDVLEAPLKFQAPGITIPLGLGIGRLVFLAMNITEAVLLVAWTLAMWRPRPARASAWLLGAVWALYLAKVVVVRPFLNARTDAVLAGLDDGGSGVHFVYIGIDVVLAIVLVVFLALQVRGMPVPPAVSAPPERASAARGRTDV